MALLSQEALAALLALPATHIDGVSILPVNPIEGRLVFAEAINGELFPRVALHFLLANGPNMRDMFVSAFPFEKPDAGNEN